MASSAQSSMSNPRRSGVGSSARERRFASISGAPTGDPRPRSSTHTATPTSPTGPVPRGPTATTASATTENAGKPVQRRCYTARPGYVRDRNGRPGEANRCAERGARGAATGARSRGHGGGARERAARPVRSRSAAQLGRFVLLKPMAGGGMGMIHRAFDPKLERRCLRVSCPCGADAEEAVRA